MSYQMIDEENLRESALTFLVETSRATTEFRQGIIDCILKFLRFRQQSPYHYPADNNPFKFNLAQFSRQATFWDNHLVPCTEESVDRAQEWMSTWINTDYRQTPHNGIQIIPPLMTALSDSETNGVVLICGSTPYEETNAVLKAIKSLQGHRRIHVIFVTAQQHNYPQQFSTPINLHAMSILQVISKDTGGDFKVAYFAPTGQLAEVVEGAAGPLMSARRTPRAGMMLMTGGQASPNSLAASNRAEEMINLMDAYRVNKMSKSMTEGKFQDLKIQIPSAKTFYTAVDSGGIYGHGGPILSTRNPNNHVGSGNIGPFPIGMYSKNPYEHEQFYYNTSGNSAPPPVPTSIDGIIGGGNSISTPLTMAALKQSLKSEYQNRQMTDKQLGEIKKMFQKLYVEKEKKHNKEKKKKPFKVSRILNAVKVKSYKFHGLSPSSTTKKSSVIKVASNSSTSSSSSSSNDSSDKNSSRSSDSDISDGEVNRLARKYLMPDTFNRAMLKNSVSSTKHHTSRRPYSSQSRTGSIDITTRRSGTPDYLQSNNSNNNHLYTHRSHHSSHVGDLDHYSSRRHIPVITGRDLTLIQRQNSNSKLLNSSRRNVGGRQDKPGWKPVNKNTVGEGPLSSRTTGGDQKTERNSWMDASENRRVRREEEFYRRAKTDRQNTSGWHGTVTNTEIKSNSNNLATRRINRPQNTSNKLVNNNYGGTQNGLGSRVVGGEKETIKALVEQNSRLIDVLEKNTTSGGGTLPHHTTDDYNNGRQKSFVVDDKSRRGGYEHSAVSRQAEIEANRRKIIKRIHEAKQAQQEKDWQQVADARVLLNNQIKGIAGPKGIQHYPPNDNGAGAAGKRHFGQREQQVKTQRQLNVEQKERRAEMAAERSQRAYKQQYDRMVQQMAKQEQHRQGRIQQYGKQQVGSVDQQTSQQAQQYYHQPADPVDNGPNYVLTARSATGAEPRAILGILPQ